MDTTGNPQAPLLGVMAEFDSAADVFRAAQALKAGEYQRYDVFSPFPIHGMDDLVPGARSPLGPIVFTGGLLGFFTAVGLTFLPSSVWYPLVVAGKPTGFFTVPAFFPIMFELTVLFASFAAFLGMLALNRLPRWHHPVFAWERFRGVSSDKFFALVESTDPRFTRESVQELFLSCGARHVTLLHEE